jgi:putative endopeptidase
LVSDKLSDAVGALYVDKVFPSHYRQQIQHLVENFRKACSERIAAAAWMAPATKREAQAKLAAMISKVGYPDTWNPMPP